jgi:hypothetical protein
MDPANQEIRGGVSVWAPVLLRLAVDLDADSKVD